MSHHAASGDLEDPAPVPTHATTGTFGEASTDLAVEAISLPILHCDVAGERVQQVDVALRVVDGLPVLEARLDHVDVEPGQVRPRCRRQVAARLEARNAEPALSERKCCLARGASDLQQARAWRQLGNPEKTVIELARILRPSTLIQ